MRAWRFAILFGALWIAAVGVAIWEGAELGRLRRLIAEHNTRQAALETQVRTMTERAKALREANAKTAAAAAKARAAQAVAAAANGNPSANFIAMLAKDPAMRAWFSKLRAASLTLDWGPFFRRLGMTGEQADKFTAIEVQFEMARIDLISQAQAAGTTLADPVYAELLHTEDHNTKADIRTLLGSTANYDAFHTYSQNLGVAQTVSDLAGADPSISDPMTGPQADQLTQILASASSKSRYGWALSGTVNWEAALPQAQAVLTPAQFAALQLLQAQQVAQRQVQHVINGR